jgi:hypothetical protein
MARDIHKYESTMHAILKSGQSNALLIEKKRVGCNLLVQHSQHEYDISYNFQGIVLKLDKPSDFGRF